MAVSDLDKARKVKRQREEAKKLQNQNRRYFQSEVERFGRMDTAMLVLTVLLVCYGLIMLFSASMSSGYAEWGNPLYFVRKQLLTTVAGFLIIFLIGHVFPIRIFNDYRLAVIVYAVITLTLALVSVMGREGVYGGVRWIEIGGFQFQPSEPAKVAAIYCLATHFSVWRSRIMKGRFDHFPAAKKKHLEAFWLISFPALCMGLWMLLIVIQPHLSGFVIMFTLCAAIFLAAGFPWKMWLTALTQLLPLLLIAILIIVMIFPLLKDGQSLFKYIGDRFQHVSTRLQLYENPDAASEDAIRQIRQSRYALGSGGLFGKGLGMGQQKSGFLPMVYNDYILPSIGEELGFIGTLSVTVLFFVYFLLGMRITLNASSLYAALLAWGCTFLITIQAFFNIAVAAEVIPSTGISLPFFSYGGSANIFFLTAAGFVLGVSKSGQKADPELRRVLKLQAANRAALKGR